MDSEFIFGFVIGLVFMCLYYLIKYADDITEWWFDRKNRKKKMKEEMKHIDGVAPSAEDTAKLNEFVSWLVEHGFNGLVLIHKGGVGVSWLQEESADSIRHTLINSLGHIYDTDENAGIDLAKGIAMAAKQLSE